MFGWGDIVSFFEKLDYKVHPLWYIINALLVLSAWLCRCSWKSRKRRIKAEEDSQKLKNRNLALREERDGLSYQVDQMFVLNEKTGSFVDAIRYALVTALTENTPKETEQIQNVLNYIERNNPFTN